MNYSLNIFWTITACGTLFLFEYFFQVKKEGSHIQLHSTYRSILKNLVGAIIMCLPLILFFNHWRHLIAGSLWNSGLQVTVLSLFALGMAMFAFISAIKKSKHKDDKQEMSAGHFGIFIASRIIFLVVYECFFRGLILYFFIQAFGVIVAVTVNILLYTLIHVLKSRVEMLACIPFGFTLCAMTIWCRSILPAVILHLVLALVHETYLQFSQNQDPKIISI